MSLDHELNQYKNVQRRRFEDRRNTLISEALETERLLGTQLMLVSTVLLTATVVFIASKTQAAGSGLSSLQSIALLLGLASTIGSMACGLAYYYRMVRYYEDWARATDKIVDIFLGDEFSLERSDKVREQVAAIQAEQDETLRRLEQQLQFIFLGIGTAFYCSLVISFLIDFGIRA